MGSYSIRDAWRRVVREVSRALFDWMRMALGLGDTPKTPKLCWLRILQEAMSQRNPIEYVWKLHGTFAETSLATVICTEQHHLCRLPLRALARRP